MAAAAATVTAPRLTLDLGSVELNYFPAHEHLSRGSGKLGRLRSS